MAGPRSALPTDPATVQYLQRMVGNRVLTSILAATPGSIQRGKLNQKTTSTAKGGIAKNNTGTSTTKKKVPKGSTATSKAVKAIGGKGGKGGGVKGGKSRPRTRVPQTKIKAAVKSEQEEMDWGSATGHTGSGLWTEEVVVRAPHSFSDERTRQVLRHLATAVFHYVKTVVDQEQEVQAMYVNNRLFLSANQPKSMAALRKLKAKELTDIFINGTYMPASDVRAQRTATKLRALVQGDRAESMTFDDPEEEFDVTTIAGLISGVVQEPGKYLVHCKANEAHKYIEDSDTELQLILVEGMNAVHAEQNLILAYVQSGSNAGAHVYGKKRPCTGCYLTFMFAREKLRKTGLTYSTFPGGYWQPAVRGFSWLINEHPTISVDQVDEFVRTYLPQDTYRSARSGSAKKDKRKSRTDTKMEDTGGDSESESDDDDKF